ncbi:MAG: 50S ribosomal protein L18 [Ignavibacteriaceae bacterium]|nr:50S ribosomal protein L18 [Ignavibacteriaceae bacterium]
MSRKLKPRERSKTRIRKKIFGAPDKPRFTVYRSLNHVYAQVIDDTTGVTVASASSLSKELSDSLKETKGKIAKGKLVGNLLAKKALEKNITTVVFDRNGYRYHGRIQAIADGAREGGLRF